MVNTDMPYYVSLIVCGCLLLFLMFLMGSNPYAPARKALNVKIVKKLRIKNERIKSWLFFKRTITEEKEAYLKRNYTSKYWVTWTEFIPFVLELLLLLVLFPSCVIYWITQNEFLDWFFHSNGYEVFSAAFHVTLFLFYGIPVVIAMLIPDDIRR